MTLENIKGRGNRMIQGLDSKNLPGLNQSTRKLELSCNTQRKYDPRANPSDYGFFLYHSVERFKRAQSLRFTSYQSYQLCSMKEYSRSTH